MRWWFLELHTTLTGVVNSRHCSASLLSHLVWNGLSINTHWHDGSWIPPACRIPSASTLHIAPDLPWTRRTYSTSPPSPSPKDPDDIFNPPGWKTAPFNCERWYIDGYITTNDKLLGTSLGIVSSHLFCNLWGGKARAQNKKGTNKMTCQGLSDNIIAN